jgi:hypothetical protein
MKLDCIALLVLLSRHKRLGVLFINNSSGNSAFWWIVCQNKKKAIFWTKLSDVNNGYNSEDFFLEFITKIRCVEVKGMLGRCDYQLSRNT